MRALLASIALLIALSTPALANRCYLIGDVPYCECRAIHRWFDTDGHEWMTGWCGHPPEVVFFWAMLIIAATLVINAAIRWLESHSYDIQQIDRDIAKTNEITRNLETAAREADAHIAAALAKVRDGDRHG